MNIKNLFINLTDPAIFQSFGGTEYWGKVEVPAGGSVFKEGDESKDFYYVFSGSVKVSKSIKDGTGTERNMANLSSGDFFGEGALLSDKTRAATVTATSDTVLLKLSQEKFEKLVSKDPQSAVGIILGIVKVLNSRLQDTNERLVAIHNVAKLVRQYQGNMDSLTPTIFKELETVTHHGVLALFGLDGFTKFASAVADLTKLYRLKNGVTKAIASFSASKGVAPSFVDGDCLYFPVYNLSGELSAVLAAFICSDCQEQDSRLLLTLAEQMAHLV